MVNLVESVKATKLIWKSYVHHNKENQFSLPDYFKLIFYNDYFILGSLPFSSRLVKFKLSVLISYILPNK